MTACAWAVLSIIVVFLLAALGDLVSEEIRGWLDLVPRAILRLAATQLDLDQRDTIYHAEWLPELCYALRGAESRPITRLIRGITYATGLLIAAWRIARRVNRTLPADAISTPVLSAYMISATNGTGRNITIGSYALTISNGNTFSLVTFTPEETIAELQDLGLFPTSVKVRIWPAKELDRLQSPQR